MVRGSVIFLKFFKLFLGYPPLERAEGAEAKRPIRRYQHLLIFTEKEEYAYMATSICEDVDGTISSDFIDTHGWI